MAGPVPPTASPADAAPAILSFWFDEISEAQHWTKDPALDRLIATRFGKVREAVLASGAKAWRDTPDHLLAAIVLLDQFSRNIHRGTARAFEGDPLALELAKLALDRDWVDRVAPDRLEFFLTPLMHSEQLADQQRSVDEYGQRGHSNLKFAILHRAQIARFARFPGRNAALGRRTKAEEQDALEDGAAF